MIVLLTGMSVLWIPLVGILQWCGLTVLKTEKAAWFPVEELREDNNVQPHKISGVERLVLGWREDGREGVCCVSTFREQDQETEQV